MIDDIPEDIRDEVLDGLVPDPVIAEQVDLALAPYRWLLPADAWHKLGWIVATLLETHPFGEALVARLSPGILVKTGMFSDPAARDHYRRTFPRMWMASTEQLRQRLREAGIPEFILPATPMRALTVFIGCIDYNESIWQDSDEYVRELTGMFCDASLAAVVLGLIEELTERPASAEEWGETGTALLRVLPRTHAILNASMAALPPADRRFLDHYRTCGWDEANTAKRLGLSRQQVARRYVDTMLDLGQYLRQELDAGAPAGGSGNG